MKIFLASLCVVLSGYFSCAQTVFWSQDFNQTSSGCEPSSSPFNWSVTDIGAQGTAANYWYIDTTVNCETPNTCLIHDTSTINRALYISYGDTCDSALYGPVYKKGCDNTTDKRVESPTVDCSGKSNIILEFDYLANKYSYFDYGYAWYSDDNGSSWDSITSRLISGFCPTYGEHKGYWKHYSISLPSSANNNPNVKIGFRWKNNDDCVGTFVSIAVDNIQLSEYCSASIIVSEDSICPGACVDFSFTSVGVTSYTWDFPGGNPSNPMDSIVHVCYNPAETSFDVVLIVNGVGCIDTITSNALVTTYPYPSPQGIMQSCDTLFANSGAVSYKWYYNGNLIPGATNYFQVAVVNGNYNVVATDIHGCEVEAVIFDVIVFEIDSSINIPDYDFSANLPTCLSAGTVKWYQGLTYLSTGNTFSTTTPGTYYATLTLGSIVLTSNAITVP